MNVERLDQAIAIIDKRIPDAQLELKLWQKPEGLTDDWMYIFVMDAAEASCKTICCAAGWLCIQPEMKEQGLSLSATGAPNYHNGKREYRLFLALEKFFDISEDEADFLFGMRVHRERIGIFENMTDKEVWLHRAREMKMKYEDKKVGPRICVE